MAKQRPQSTASATFRQGVTNGHSSRCNYRSLCSLTTLCHFVRETRLKEPLDMTRQSATCDRTASAHVTAATPTSRPAGDMQGERGVHLTLCLCPVTAH